LSTIEIRIDGSAGAQSGHRRFARPSDGYLPQVEAFCLPRLLPHDAASEFGFYWYNAQEGKITFRTDRVTPTLDGFVITTRLSLRSNELRTTFDKDGTMLKKEIGDGRTLIRSNVRQLQAIWKTR
jgi:hypothetical protein